MIRSLKTCGLALISALAISAVVASAAQGAEWEVEGGGEAGVYFTGTQITHNSKSFHTITVGKFEVHCEETFFTGEVQLPKFAKLTLTPTYNKCKTQSGLPVTITMNSCDYTIYGGTQSEKDKNDYFDGAMIIDCPGAVKQMEIHIYANATEHSNGKSMCKATIHEQGPVVANTYTNTATGTNDVDVTTELEIADEMSGNPFLCGTGGKGSYTGGTTLKAFSDAAHTKQINFHVGG